MTRKASAQAYAAIVASGWISRSRKAVYGWLYEHGPADRNAIDRALGQGQPNPTYSRRLVEMESMGIIARVGQTKGQHGMTVDLWDVTDAMPPAERPRRAKVKKVDRTETYEQLRKLLTHPRALSMPDGTLRAALSIIEATEGEAGA